MRRHCAIGPSRTIAFVELVCSRNECSVAKAAQWIEENMGTRFHKSAASIQNDYADSPDVVVVYENSIAAFSQPILE